MDQTQDLSGKDFYRYTRLYAPPEFVKQATLEDLCGSADLPTHLYGDPAKRLYPCHTPAAAWTSLAYLLDKQAGQPAQQTEPVVQRILDCGRVLGVEAELQTLRQKYAQDRPAAEDVLPDEDFALILRDGTQTERHYPLRNGPEVKAAADYLLAHRDRFPFALRQQFADRVLDKQARLGVRLEEGVQEILEKQAGRGAGTSAAAAELILGRVEAVRRGPGADSELQKEMLKMAQLIRQRPSQLRAPGMRCKVAAVVDAFDRQHGRTNYGPGFPRVEDVLFELTREKMASCAREHVGLLTGSIYKMADLERVRLAEVKGLFGDDFGEALTSDGLRIDGEKAAEVLPTLPAPDAHLLDRLLHGLGVLPVAKEASARAVAIGNDFLRQVRATARS
jgi:hypothetical protein